MAAQIGLLHNCGSKLEEAEQVHHIAVALIDDEAAVDVPDSGVVVDIEIAVVVKDKEIPHHFVCTIPVWHLDSYTSE